MIRPQNETEDSLFSISKNFETLTKQTREKPQETFDSKLSNQEKHFILIYP